MTATLREIARQIYPDGPYVRIRGDRWSPEDAQVVAAVLISAAWDAKDERERLIEELTEIG